MRDDSFFRGIRGPVGSGKSSLCCVEVFRRALQQKKGPDGKRHSRWVVTRNSYPELRTTTIETWKQWFPEDVWGPVRMHPPPYMHRLEKGDVVLEVLFLALDQPDDVKKVLSLELTGVFINEARETSKEIVDALTMRVGRYPSMKDGGPSWYGVIADTNAPDEDHWWPIMAGEAPAPEHFSESERHLLVKPPNWKFFTQPGAMTVLRGKDSEITGYEPNPEAENAQNLTEGYYPRIIEGKGADWIKVYVLNELGSILDGKPVYGDFDRKIHVAAEPILPVPGIPITVGLDFGLTPAAVFGQVVRRQWRVLHELVAFDMGVSRFADLLRLELAQRFPGHTANVWGDPAGDFRSQTDERTPFQILRQAGIIARPAPTNDPALRIEAVSNTMTRLIDGKPGRIIDPRCTHLIKGYSGSYHYKKLKLSGTTQYENTPEKGKFSHVCDADQYMTCGGGESRQLTMGGKENAARVARGRIDPFNRAGPSGTSRSRRNGSL